MRLSKKGELEMKIEELKKETGLSEQEVKDLFIRTYLLDNEKEDPDKLFGELLHGKKEEE